MRTCTIECTYITTTTTTTIRSCICVETWPAGLEDLIRFSAISPYHPHVSRHAGPVGALALGRTDSSTNRFISLALTTSDLFGDIAFVFVKGGNHLTRPIRINLSMTPGRRRAQTVVRMGQALLPLAGSGVITGTGQSADSRPPAGEGASRKPWMRLPFLPLPLEKRASYLSCRPTNGQQ